MNTATRLAIGATERGWVPDAVIRRGIRHLVGARLEEVRADDCERIADDARAFVGEMDSAVIAPVPDKANAQHYELPPEFFDAVLGSHRKYSSCYWAPGVTSLDEAEAASLALTCEHAGLADGMRILELGCGWGSLTLWMAKAYPNAWITAVSNSRAQRKFLTREAMRLGLTNVEVITADMNDFEAGARYDRVVSVEMFEHMRNYRALFERVNRWLSPGGRFFMHIFCHRAVPYEFAERDPSDWMARYFFSGGIMPSDDLPLRFQDHLRFVDQWRWNGTHYEKTANAWIANMDRRRERVWPILEQTYGADEALRWWMRWRIFFAACAELFGCDDGQQWWVSHYLFERRDLIDMEHRMDRTVDRAENRTVQGAAALAGVAGVVMAAALAYGFAAGDFSAEGAALVSMPWGVTALVETYVGMALFAGWIAWRERRAVRAAGWIVAMVLVGNLVSCAYVLLAARGARGDAARFWHGERGVA